MNMPQIFLNQNMDTLLHDLISFEPKKVEEGDLVSFEPGEKQENDLISFELQEEQEETNDLTNVDLLDNNFSDDSELLSNIGEQFISLCVEPGDENIFSIDLLNKLQKLLLSITASCPIDSGRFCIPCSEEISVNSDLFDQHLRNKKHLKMLKQLEDDESIKKLVIDQYTRLDLAKSMMQIVLVDNYVKCFACNVRVGLCDIKNHINSQNHTQNIRFWKISIQQIFDEKKVVFCDAWYYAENFVCDLCSLKFYSDLTFADHLIKTHLDRDCRAEPSAVGYELCAHCLTFWFGKINRFITHYEGIFHKYLVQNESFLILDLDKSVKNVLNNFENSIKKLLESCHNFDTHIEENILQSIHKIVRTRYAFSEVFLCGSRKSRTNFSESNLDIYVDCVSSYSSIMSGEQSTTYLKNILDVLPNFDHIWMVEEVVFQDEMPIIKLRHIHSKLICDISTINGLAVEKAELIKCYVNSYPPCRALILFLKKWMYLCRLSGSQGISSFSISCLVIYYLQVTGILPSVHNLIKLENNPNIVAGWETGFLKQIPLPIPIENCQLQINDECTKIFYNVVKDLLMGFFSFYSNFNYITDVICPFLGKVVKKSVFTNMELALPQEMKIYKSLYEKRQAEIFRFDSPMCIQDPIDLSKNITKTVTKFKLRMFKQYCSESLFVLHATTKRSQG